MTVNDIYMLIIAGVAGSLHCANVVSQLWHRHRSTPPAAEIYATKIDLGVLAARVDKVHDDQQQLRQHMEQSLRDALQPLMELQRNQDEVLSALQRSVGRIEGLLSREPTTEPRKRRA